MLALSIVLIVVCCVLALVVILLILAFIHYRKHSRLCVLSFVILYRHHHDFGLQFIIQMILRNSGGAMRVREYEHSLPAKLASRQFFDPVSAHVLIIYI